MFTLAVVTRVVVPAHVAAVAAIVIALATNIVSESRTLILRGLWLHFHRPETSVSEPRSLVYLPEAQA